MRNDVQAYAQIGYTDNVSRIVRMKEMTKLVGLSKNTIYDRLNPNSPRFDKSFPAPLKIGVGARAVGWIYGEVLAWLAGLSQ